MGPWPVSLLKMEQCFMSQIILCILTQLDLLRFSMSSYDAVSNPNLPNPDPCIKAIILEL